MTAMVEFTVLPLGTPSTSARQYVAKALKALKDAGYSYQLTPMGTIVETPTIEEALKAVTVAHNSLFGEGVQRVVTVIKVDDRRDKPGTRAQGKVEAALSELRKLEGKD